APLVGRVPGRAGPEGLLAGREAGLPASGADLPVELETELRGTLEDVEELAERKVDDGEDHRDGVELRQEAVVHSAQIMRRDREQEAGRGDGEEERQRDEVGGELLDGQRAAVAGAPPEREEDADDDEHR